MDTMTTAIKLTATTGAASRTKWSVSCSHEATQKFGVNANPHHRPEEIPL